MSWIVDIAVGLLRGMGRKDLADWITNAPGQLGELIGKILAGGISSNGNLSAEAVSELEALKAANPRDSAQKPADLVEEFLADMNSLLGLVAPLKVIAVKGFFHDPDCLTVIHIERADSIPLQLDNPGLAQGKKQFSVTSGGIRVLVLPSTSDENLREINLRIERHPDTFLLEIEKLDWLEVASVEKNYVVLNRKSTKKSALPPREEREIVDPSAIGEAFRTLSIAKGAQSSRLQAYRSAAETRRKPGDPQ